jgi:hypothetical protein
MCHTPITIRKDTPDQLTVGCGRCVPCHLKYCNQWAIRMKVHATHNPIFWCITLTYSGQYLPYVKATDGKVYMTLKRSHASNFFKTLRNNHNKTYKGHHKPKISYMICGEYGDKFKRPHYHAIVFGSTPDDIIKSWPYGHIHFGANNLEAATNYALKYSMKSRLWKLGKSTAYIRPFIHVSKGIGEDMIVQKTKIYQWQKIDYQTGEVKPKKYIIKCVTSDIPEILDNDGIKIQLPRYYTKKLGIDIDTTELREKMQDRQKQVDTILREKGTTRAKFQYDYQMWLWSLNKQHHYDNEILTTTPIEFLKDYE